MNVVMHLSMLLHSEKLQMHMSHKKEYTSAFEELQHFLALSANNGTTCISVLREGFLMADDWNLSASD